MVIHWLSCSVWLCVLAPLVPAQVSLVRDIHRGATDNPDSWPGPFTKIGNWYYFAATHDAIGAELYRTLGTPNSLQLVKDIQPGPQGSSPRWLAAVGSILYFTADDGMHGAELWKSDGTAAGTQLVRDVLAGTAGSKPSHLTPVGTTLFFQAADGRAGRELWKSDGTARGTVLVKDIFAGPNGSEPWQLTPFGTEVWFQAADATTGHELWKSDGTAPGTVRVHDAWPGSSSGEPHTLTPFANKLYFVATTGQTTNALFASDGTPAGTSLIKSWPLTRTILFPLPAEILGVHRGALFVSAHHGDGRELWKSDGTANGTVLLKDLRPSGGSDPVGLAAVGNRFCFSAMSGAFWRELWVCDGTATGTVPILTADTATQPSGLLASGGAVWFAARDRSAGTELFKTDGTPKGTSRLKDIRPGAESSRPGLLAPFGNGVIFAADDGTRGREVWTSDGTTAGTRQIHDVNPASGATLGSNPGEITDRFGVAYFQADDGVHGAELWRSDGTQAGTFLVKDILPGPTSGSPFRLRLVGDTLYFTAQDKASDWQLFKSDGTAPGTVKVAQLPGGSSGALPQEVVPFRGRVYFGAVAASGLSLWATDGTATGTVEIKKLPSSGSWPIAITVVNDAMYLVGADETHGLELWKSDGTPAGTSLLKDTGAGRGNFPRHLTGVGDRLVFSSRGSSSRALWVSDGTAAGTVMVPKATDPQNLTRVGDVVFFTAGDSSNGFALWKTDGTASGTVRLTAIELAATPFFANLDDRLLLFGAASPATGFELWRSDGTTAGTMLVRDIQPGRANGLASDFFATGSRHAYFAGDDGTTGPELWVTDGTAAGTRRVQDIRRGAFGSMTTYFRVWFELSRGSVLFTADDGATGVELYRFDPGASVQRVGTSCGSTRPDLAATDPVLGKTIRLSADRAPLQTIGLLKLGFPDPAPIALPGCFSYVDLRRFYLDLGVQFVTSPRWSVAVPVPNDAGLLGAGIAVQAWYVRVEPLAFELSNGLYATLGR